MRQLTEKLARVNENLARKIASRNEFDRTIAETEAAYLKVGLSAVPCQCLARLRGCTAGWWSRLWDPRGVSSGVWERVHGVGQNSLVLQGRRRAW